MPDVPVSEQDVTGLAEKLGSLEPDLSDPQRALLVGVFAVARDAIASGTAGGPSSPLVEQVPPGSGAPPLSVDAPEPLPPLKDVFSAAFTPGEQAAIGGAAAVKWEASGTIKVSN